MLLLMIRAEFQFTEDPVQTHLPTLQSNIVLIFSDKKTLNQIIKCLNQIISENKPYNLRLCTFTLHKFPEKNLNLNRDSNSDLQISSLALN